MFVLVYSWLERRASLSKFRDVASLSNLCNFVGISETLDFRLWDVWDEMYVNEVWRYIHSVSTNQKKAKSTVEELRFLFRLINSNKGLLNIFHNYKELWVIFNHVKGTKLLKHTKKLAEWGNSAVKYFQWPDQWSHIFSGQMQMFEVLRQSTSRDPLHWIILSTEKPRNLITLPLVNAENFSA